MLEEWKKARSLFKKPTPKFYFGFWSVPSLIGKMGSYCLEHKDEDTLKKRICGWLSVHCKTFPGLPVWRRGNTIRIFRNKQMYEYSKGGYIWQPEFEEKLKKLHLSWLKPSYELPVWLSFYLFKIDMCWKWKYDDVRYEFPPQITLVLFNIAFGIVWVAPRANKDDIGNDDMYWESILNYNHKFEDKDSVNLVFELSDYVGYWTRCSDKDNYEITWTLKPCYLKNKKLADLLYQYQTQRTVEIKERRKAVTCPKCGRIMHKTEDKVLTSLPPKYEYVCPNCGEVKYLEKNIETWKLF